jgi:hypothetical protein
MKVELKTVSQEGQTQDEYAITLKRHELERLHLLILAARANGTQEFARAITGALLGVQH